MTKKPRKTISQKGISKKSTGKSYSFSAHKENWLARGLFAFLGAAICYILLPRLEFTLVMSDSSRVVFSFFIFLLIIWGTSSSFEKNKTWIAWVLAGIFLLELSANLNLQFKWADSGILLRAVASLLILPTGALWACLLAKSNIGDNQQSTPSTFISAFSKPAVLIPAMLVFGIGCFLVFYKLGYYDFWEDEGMVINAAVGLRDEGMEFLNEGYDRAWMHSWLVSQSIQIFGESEWSARFPSALFGMIFILASFVIFYKWFHNAWLAILIPLVCLLTDEFLILFRYTRMYALLIPLFLVGLYLSFLFLTKEVNRSVIPWLKNNDVKFNWLYGLAALSVMVLAYLIHALAAVGFLGLFFLLFILWLSTRQGRYKTLLLLAVGIGVLSLLLGQAGVRYFHMIPNAIKRMMMESKPEYAYYKFLFNNGLPANMTLMTLIAGMGLLLNKQWGLIKKQLLSFLYGVIILDLVFMTYLLSDQGRDYRYVVHVVPLVVCIEFIVLFAFARIFSNRFLTIGLAALPIVCAGIALSGEYKEVYIRHPWSPRYSEVYPDISNQYKPGEAIFYQNIKTYYLDPETLAGEHAIKMGRRKEYTLDQFKSTLKQHSSAWVVFDTHKAYHVDPEIIQYVSKNFGKLHGTGVDETGVEVFHLVQ